MAAHTTGAIALRPTYVQGGYFFYSLYTGRVLNRNHWTKLPVPTDVIERVHVLVRGSNLGAFILNFDYSCPSLRLLAVGTIVMWLSETWGTSPETMTRRPALI